MKTIGLILLACLTALIVVGVFPLIVVALMACGSSFVLALQAAVSFYVGFWSVLTLVLTVMGLFCLGRIVLSRRSVRSDGPVSPSDADPKIAIVAFAVVAMFSVNTLSSLAADFSSQLQQLFLETAKLSDPMQVQALISEVSRLPAGSSSEMVPAPIDGSDESILLGVHLRVISQVVGIYGRVFAGLLRCFTAGSVVVFGCWWLMIYLVGRLIASTSAENTGMIDRARTWLANLSVLQRRRLLLGAVFVVGLYFSIAAVIAIPALQKSNSTSSITRDYVEKALGSVSTSQEAFQLRFPESYKQELPAIANLSKTLDALGQVIEQRSADLPDAERTEYKKFYRERLDVLRNYVREVSLAREQRLGWWTKMRNETLTRQQNMSRQAASAFEVGTLNPLSGPERVGYLQDVVAWFQNAQIAGENSLQQAMGQIDIFDLYVGMMLGNFEQVLFAVEPPSATRSYASASADPLYRVTDWMQQLPLLPIDRVDRSVPSAPEPGAYAGVFGFIARWLLRTRSFSLALITGMIGFGLLGAAATNYVRTDFSDGHEILAGRVIIQGVSAAIVIFLSVHGGLAMLSTDENQANGYVMCFACLVGAVFSEHVWQWARGRLETLLPQNAQGGQTQSVAGVKPGSNIPSSPANGAAVSP